MSGEIGSALVIPESVLDSFKDADERLAKLQKRIYDTGDISGRSFGKMVNGTTRFSSVLDAVIQKLKEVEKSSVNASAAFNAMSGAKFGNAATQAEKLNTSIVRAAENIERLTSATRDRQGDSGLKNISVTLDALWKKLKDTRVELELYWKYISTGKKDNVEFGQKGLNEASKTADALMRQITALDAAYKQLRRSSANVNDMKGQTLADMRQSDILRKMSEYYRDMERSSAAAAKEAEKRARSEEKAAKAQSKIYQQQNYARNTTYAGALSFAEDANTINRRTQAIKYLQEARAALSATDSEYASKLRTLNDRIKQLNAANNEAIAGSKNLVNEHRRLFDITGQLSRSFALLFSVSQIRGYIANVATVRGEFEMSQRSLEAILQNKTQADEIFAKTVELAVKSPFRIKDLVQYTRQLAAYRIESDKLFDTTKRLADVSAGLGVDMQRLILAYGQVKAAAYLRGSEVRQFTEAGVNMYGELQRYFQEVKGEAYTTAQIVDMISKRMVTFQDVEAVFERMTSDGGIFFNMQEIQAETLQGKISNFQDSLDVMLNSIGKANEGLLKGAIDGATALLEHWEELVDVGKALAAILLTIKARSMFLNSTLGIAFTQADTKGLARYKALFVNAFTSMGNAVKSFGTIAKTSLVGLGIFAAIELITTAIGKWSDYNKKVKEAQEDTIKTREEIRKISSAYNDLADTATTADTKDLQKNIDKRRIALQRLIDSAAKDGLVLKINVEEVKDEDLNKTFDSVEKKYKDFVDELEIIRRNYAESNRKLVFDGIDDDREDYKNAVLDFLSQSSKIETAVAIVNANYDKATAATKKYFDEIRAGQKAGESNLDYMRRMAAALQQMNVHLGGNIYATPGWLDGVEGMVDIVDTYNSVEKAGAALEKEYEKVFGDLRDKYKNDPIKIKAAIDKVAAEEDWSQYDRELAYRHFGINVKINKDTMEQEVSWVDDYLSNFFAKKKYGVSLVVKEVTDGKALSEFLKKGDDAAKAAKNWQELERRISAVGKNVKQIKVDDSIRKLFKAGDIRLSGETIDVSTLKDVIAEYKKAATETSESLGVDPFSKENAKSAKSAAKQQRDILQEQISLLKEMMEVYEKLTPMISDENAAKRVLEEYRDDLQYVKMDKSIIDSFVPTKEGMIKALNQLLPTITDFKKKAEVMKLISKYEIEIDSDELKKQLDGAEKEADRIFSNLDLFRKLKEQGLDDGAIQRMFGNLTMSFEDARKQLDSLYADKQGGDWTKQKEEQFDKLTKKINDFNLAQTQDILKDYGKQLDERLKLDLWYINERAKIENKELKFTPEQREEYIQALDRQKAEKAANLEWEQFKNTETYIEMFNNLDNVSSHMLERMREKLEALKSSLKGLSPEQLKAIQEQINKIDDEILERNPLKDFGKNLNQFSNASKSIKELEKTYDVEKQKLEELEDKLDEAAEHVNKLNEAYAKLSDSDKRGDAGTKLNNEINDAKRQYDEINKKVNEQEKNVANVTKELNKWQRILKTLGGQFEYIGLWFGAISSGVTEISANLENVFGTMSDGIRDTIESISDIAGGLGQTASGIGQLVAPGGLLNPSAWVSTIGGITKTIGSLFNIGDKKKERQIKRLTEQVESLQHAYENLEQEQSDAWSITELDKYTEKLKDNLEMQNANLRAMIAAEEDKKKKDKDRIKEWREQIEENEKAIKKAQDTLQEEIGGFGSKANYKSAAQAFADAWVDAFNEGSDTLVALESQLDEVFDNLLKKQVSYRVADNIINSLLKPLDDALVNYDGSSSSLQSLRQSLEKIREESPETLKAFDEAMKSIADTLGFEFGAGADSESSLSALQQGIQGITEQTAEALEALLNSIRFFVAKQTEDIAAIRALMSGSQSIDMSSTDNPMVTILREQAGYLRSMLSIMTDMWNQAFAAGHPKGGRGLKVFM